MGNQGSLFEKEIQSPLASRVRPNSFDAFIGQSHLLGRDKILRKMIETDQLQSIIFYGPPGVGKTTLALVIAKLTRSRFLNFSAVTSGIKEIREVMTKAIEHRYLGEKTIVFVDEIHRFNKAQQDAFLPHVENGNIILIGATTENPSFEINRALLSRCKVFLLNPLEVDDLILIMKNAILDPRGYNGRISIDDALLKRIAIYADSDAREALNTLERAVLISRDKEITQEAVIEALQKKSLAYDKTGEEHYNIISALHKSMRNSDADASVYWLARMLEGGEDPLYIARRLVRFASEDIGLADPRALEITIACYNACHYNGMPECNVNLT